MSVLGHLQPESVFRFFEEICQIPHGSGNTAQMTEYLMNFAAERNIWAKRDEVGNVIMRKPATAGYEEVPGIIIQGHMDMVAVKKPDCSKDMLKEGLDIAVDGDYIYAIGTSLGGDNGVAVAYGLAIMDAENLSHPEVEAIFTIDEETGLDGAKAIDMSDIRGTRFLNLDSEDEGTFLTSCAGGAGVNGALPIEIVSKEGVKVSVALKGLQGGHSGADIHKERGNALYLLARVLKHAKNHIEFNLCDFYGGTVDNAIPREAYATVVLDTDLVEAFVESLKESEKTLQTEYAKRDPDLYMEVVADEKNQADTYAVWDETTTFRALSLLVAAPVGVQAMSQDIEGLVETSLNLGVVKVVDDMVSSKAPALHIVYSVRSSIESAKQALLEKLETIFKMADASFEVEGEYPGWAYKVDSPLREKMARVYEEMYSQKPIIMAIHAGLECGLFLNKKPDLDCISLGPNMCSIHTTEEKLSISSTRRVWEFLVAVLADKA